MSPHVSAGGSSVGHGKAILDVIPHGHSARCDWWTNSGSNVADDTLWILSKVQNNHGIDVILHHEQPKITGEIFRAKQTQLSGCTNTGVSDIKQGLHSQWFQGSRPDNPIHLSLSRPIAADHLESHSRERLPEQTRRLPV